ncbi:MAG: chemotaxis response regulator protein-glutamate methylesterase [Bryobacteraceae bacterium]
MNQQPIRVLIADDSPFVCRLLASYLQSSPEFVVVGLAHTGKEAVAKTKELRPNVITLDLEMPEMDGLEALRHIMRDNPTPVLVVSGVSGTAATRTHQAIDLGAVDFILKYAPGVKIDARQLRREILAKVRAGAKTRVVRLLDGKSSMQGPIPSPPRRANGPPPTHVVVVGSSTGGPLALRELLGALPASFPGAIVLVQHLPKSFTGPLTSQLARYCPLEVREAETGDRLAAGKVLVAPGGYHLLLRPGYRVLVQSGPEVNGHCPSIDVTMESAAASYGGQTRGVVLTGMGNDGTAGLRSIRAAGGVTFAQDAASCVVNGMPQSAIDQGVVDHVATPARIGSLLAAGIQSGRLTYAIAE